jgi:uncharacterized repeat protein (TIGR03803 family)
MQGVTFDDAGNLYGTTPVGGSSNSEGGGVVYKLSPGSDGWNQTVVHAFLTGGLSTPSDLVGTVQVFHDRLYSTNLTGGAFDQGGVFRLDMQGKGNEIASFNGTDGANPIAGVLIDYNSGDIYGTTSADYSTATAGTVFKISGGQLTVLWTFNPEGPAGANPFAALIADKQGHLYGTTVGGGKNDEGTVFEITP